MAVYHHTRFILIIGPFFLDINKINCVIIIYTKNRSSIVIFRLLKSNGFCFQIP